MKRCYLLFFTLIFAYNTLNADFDIFARGNKIGTYRIFKSGNKYYTISNLSFNILGYKKEIVDSSYSILKSDYTLKYFDYIHYENKTRREIIGERRGNKIILNGDENETLYVKKRKVYTDIGIEMILPKMQIPDTIELISSGIWQTKKMYCFRQGDTIIVSDNKVQFKYIYSNGKFKALIGQGGLFIGNRKGNIFKKDILNSYRIKTQGKRISNKKYYKKIVFKSPNRYKFPEIKGFQYYSNENFVVNPMAYNHFGSKEDYLKPTEYYDYNKQVFKSIIKRLKGQPAVAIAKYVRDIMRATPNMYPEKASEILKKRKGDCSEYATLLSALLRGEGYPAYNVYGLIYMKGYYYYHAWTKVLDNDGWRYLDATRGCYCDAKYIILQSDVKGGFSTDISFLPVKSLKIIDAR